jgi:response regulator of citrate/malate metabolism
VSVEHQRNVPAIVVGLEAGFLAHLVKPINFEQLDQVLQQIIPVVESKANVEALG